MGAISLPVQVIRTQKSHNNKNNNDNNTVSITTTTTADTINANQKGYRYIPKQSQSLRPLTMLKGGTKAQRLMIPTVSRKQNFLFIYIIISMKLCFPPFNTLCHVIECK